MANTNMMRCLYFIVMIKISLQSNVKRVTTGTNNVLFGKKLDITPFKILSSTGQKLCEKECLNTANCLSYNFDRNTFTCGLNSGNEDSHVLRDHADNWYSRKANMKKDLVGSCADIKCPASYKCVEQNGHAHCISTSKKESFMDCKQMFESNITDDGVYTVSPDGSTQFRVYCDLTNGGWTVIQRRVDDKVNFDRGWSEYVAGFGDLSSSHWLGLNYIYLLTRQPTQITISFKMRDTGNVAVGTYNTFYIDGESDEFMLHVNNTGSFNTEYQKYMGYPSYPHFYYHNGMRFSTTDNENDANPGNCAVSAGGWWHNSCYTVGSFHDAFSDMHIYDTNHYYVTSVEMKIRRRAFIDCKEMSEHGTTDDGLYTVSPDGSTHFRVYCDITNGGWTVIQRRVDDKVNFDRDWVDYVAGFGDLSSSHWLGLNYIYLLTRQTTQITITFTMSETGNVAVGMYDNFFIDGESNEFVLHVDNTGSFNTEYQKYMDNPSLPHFYYHNGMRFTTKDNDNDPVPAHNCANFCGGWWSSTVCCTVGNFHSSFSEMKIYSTRAYFVTTVEIKIRRT